MTKFTLHPFDEIHLHEAPLAKVLTLVSFSRTPALTTDAAEAQIADLLGRYPVRRRQLIGPPTVVIQGQPMQMPVFPGTAPLILTFSQPTGSWTVTLTDASVAIDTSDYSSRDDFCERALEVFNAVAKVALPPVVDRLGVRYINRLTGLALGQLDEWVIPQLQSLHGSVEGMAVHHSVTDTVIDISPTDRFQVRTGLLPPNTAFDPALPPVNEPSWLLDMDGFTTQAGFPFDPEALANKVRSFAETAYAFFRFATTESFQEAHQAETTKSLGPHER
jgi:uncharacterized protein (TIGR04255 family)